MPPTRKGSTADKTCTRCNACKPVTEYDYDTTHRRYTSWCKECRRAAQAATEPRRQAVRAFYKQVEAAGGLWQLVAQAPKGRKE